MPIVYKARVVLPHTSGLPADEDDNTFIFQSNHPDVASSYSYASSALTAFYNTSLAAYIDAAIDRGSNKCRIEYTDITAHLSGSAAGPPSIVDTFTLAGAGAGAGLCPAETAAVTTIYGAGRATAPVLGPTSSIPTDHRAQTEGAPPTHSGRTRPKQSHTGRLYIGPLNANALARDGGEVRLAGAFTAALALACHTLEADMLLDSPTQAWVVWSRKLASVDQVNGGHVDNAPDTQRRRGVQSTARVAWT